MAFFCPVFGNKKNSDYCDIGFQYQAGSPFDLKAYTTIKVTNDFQPTVDDEIGVSTGELVTGLYREKEWTFVRRSTGVEGFIPTAYCLDDPPNIAKQSQLKRSPAASAKGSRGPAVPIAKSRSVTSVLFRSNSERVLPELSKPSKSAPQNLVKGSTKPSKSAPENLAKGSNSERVLPELSKPSKSAPENLAKGSISSSQLLKSEPSKNAPENLVKATSHSQLLLPSSRKVANGTASASGSVSSPPKGFENVSRFLRSLEEEQKAKEVEPLTSPAPLAPTPSPQKELVIPIVQQRRSSLPPDTSAGVVTEWICRPQGQFVVLQTFVGRDEQDLSAVSRGETVTLLNRDDPDWFWVSTKEKREGFIPSAFVTPTAPSKSTPGELGGTQQQEELISTSFSPPSPSRQREMLVIRDYFPSTPNGLCARRGDWVFCSPPLTIGSPRPLPHRDDLVWAYCPRTRQNGFITHAVLKSPLADF